MKNHKSVSVESKPAARSKGGDAAANTVATPRRRNPNTPFISLERAIEQTKAIYGKDRLRDIPLRVACERWEFKLGGSQSDQTVGALKSFGLIEINGTGDGKSLHISERAYRILEGANDAGQRIKDAALSPAIHAEMWQKFGTTGCLPDGDVMRHYLQFDRVKGRFTKEAADALIGRFRDTVAFAKLESSDKIDPERENEDEDENAAPDRGGGESAIAIGDFILWDSQGIAQFAEPKRVRWISDDGLWVAVDGGGAGLPIGETRKVDPPKDKVVPMNANNPAAIQSVPPLPPLDTGKGVVAMSQDTFTIGGSVALIRWPETLSAEQFADLQDWIELQLRKTARESGIPIPKKN